MKYSKPENFTPDLCFLPGHRRAGSPRCRAWNPNQGRQCSNSPIQNRRTCKSHRGKAARGVESSTFKHGRYSKDLPTRYAGRYEAAQIDPNILDQRPEIAVLQTRLSELLQRIDEAEAGQWFKRLNKARTTFIEAGTVEKKKDCLEYMLYLIEQGADTWAIWDDIARTMEQHRRLVADQTKSDQNADLLISLEKLTIIFGFITKLIHEHVPNRDARARIAAGLDPVFVSLIPGYVGRAGNA